MPKERLHYMDIAKGLMITFLMFGHFKTDFYSLGLASESLEKLTDWHDYFLVFYMQGFFLVTGYCANFDKPWKKFFVANVKGLIIPAVLFTIICRGILGVAEGQSGQQIIHYIFSSLGYWFLWALFFAKILYYSIRKIQFSGLLLLLLSIVTDCIYIYTSTENTIFWMNTLLCAPFLYVGETLRNYSGKMRLICILSAVFFISLVTILKYLSLPRPSVTAAIIIGSWKEIPLYLLLATTGSMSCLGLAKYIGKNYILELIGRNTLIIYCVHVFVLILIIRGINYAGLFGNANLCTMSIFYVTASIAALFTSLGASVILSRYSIFKYLTGRW